MDEKEFEQTIKLTELFYGVRSSDVDPKQVEEFEKAINEIADRYIFERNFDKKLERYSLLRIQKVSSRQRDNALVNLFSDAIKVCPSLASKQDENGNTFMHKMANAGFWSVCLSAVECVPDSMDVKNNKGKTFVDIYGAGELIGSCAKILRLCGGTSEELKGVYKTLCEKYPEAKDPYAETLNEYIRK